MAKAKRVFELAKELGVKSKAIVEKCQAEDVPGITNHMSTVKLGLAQTIRQWFGEAESEISATAVEVAQKVDLKKVRKAKRKKKVVVKSQSDDSPPPAASASETATATLEAPPVTQPATAEGAPALDEPLVEVELEPEPEPVTSSPSEAPVEEVAPPSQAASPAEAVPAEAAPSGPAGVPNVPQRPKVVKPAGELLAKPQQAQLKGPNVVRIEKPEPVEQRPRPRRTGGPGGRSRGGDNAAEAPGVVPGISRSRGPARGKGAGGGAGGNGPVDGKPTRRRTTNTRRGRSADALPTGPSKFSQADMEELDARLRGATGFLKQRRRDLRKRENVAQTAQSAVVTGGTVTISEPITIKSLSAETGIKSVDIIKYLFDKGIMATINSAIDTDAALEIALEYNIELEVKQQETAEQLVLKQFETREAVDVKPRPAVVTVLGHVDHGKTSLLDKIRKADVAAHEDGGITQHIGAYRITIQGSDEQTKTVVFLDTPGHEAFTSMRSRGAKMTDLIVLVVAADDGVMPQTIESINHAKAGDVPIIVALNKIDVAQATEENIRKIYGQLAEHGLNPVEWGGETEIIKTSAETGEGITDLVEILDYQAELLELKADYGGPARGTVIETQMQPGRGSVARVLVQEGQINVGDYINIGRAFGRVRDMTDDRGRSIKQAGPATPLELSGIGEVPDAGDKLYVTDTLQKAEQVALQYREAERQKQLASQTKVTLANFAATIKAGQTLDLRVVLKADVHGSVQVLRKSLEDLGNDEVAVKVLHAAVGGITESDVVLADASDAVILGFHVTATPAVREIADSHKVDIRLYRVIYDLIDNITQALEGMLKPERKEEELGSAEVRQIFKISKLGQIAGCLVTSGSIQKSAVARLAREGVVITDDRKIESLRRVKEDAKEVRAGTECGIRLAGFEDIKPGDIITCYKVTQVKRTLS